MSIENYRTPAEIFKSNDKPFHQTGEIHLDRFLNNISLAEIDLLRNISKKLYRSAEIVNTKLNVLVVGSAANLRSTHVDIDLLIVPENLDVRGSFPTVVKNLFKSELSIFMHTQFPKGSAINWRSFLWAPSKLFISTKDGSTHTMFDVTFAGDNGGSFEDFLQFHRENSLAFCELNDSLLKTF